MRKQEIYIVKFMSTGVAEAAMRYSKKYPKYAIIKVPEDKRSMDEIIESFRKQEEEATQKTNPQCKAITKLVSKEKILVSLALISKGVKS